MAASEGCCCLAAAAFASVPSPVCCLGVKGSLASPREGGNSYLHEAQLGVALRTETVSLLLMRPLPKHRPAFYPSCKETVLTLCNHLIVAPKVFPEDRAQDRSGLVTVLILSVGSYPRCWVHSVEFLIVYDCSVPCFQDKGALLLGDEPAGNNKPFLH